MKKYLTIVCCAMLISAVGFVAVKAGYYTGPNNSLYVTATAGWNWLEGTLANDSAQHYKKIFVQDGNEGTWSDLVPPTTHSVTHRDKRGLFDKDYSMMNPCWKVNASDPLSCRS